MKSASIFLVFVMGLTVGACGGGDGLIKSEKKASTLHTVKSSAAIATWYVASKQVDCVGVAPMKCLQVKKSKSSKYENFYSEIKGFSFVEGYEYTLQVLAEPQVNGAADASSMKYSLVKELDKTKVK